MSALPQVILRSGALMIALAALAACERSPTESRPHEELLAASGATPDHPDEWFGLYVMRPDGSDPRRLTLGIPVHEPEWSPEGRRLAFFGSADAEATRGIYIINEDGTHLRRITQGPDAYPTWSPDGKWLAFGGHTDGPGIYVMRPDGTDMRRIRACEWNCSRPSWSPDGQHIAYVEWTPAQQVYVMRSDGSQPVRLSHDLAYSTDPDWSPDSRYLVLAGQAAGEEGEYHLFLAKTADGTITRVTTTPAGYRAPTFSRDGYRIAFSLFSSFNGQTLSQIYDIGRNGQGVTQITSGPGTFAEPSWRP